MFPYLILMQDMGMRVIGALKHAGRRRAAFSVAKDVALFLRCVCACMCVSTYCACIGACLCGVCADVYCVLKHPQVCCCRFSPCREEGRLEEVVELLSDICKYYSGQGWVEISEGVYTTLAASLKELGRMEDYVRTVVALINLYSWEPDLPAADGKVAPWMEELERLSLLPREGMMGCSCKWERVGVWPGDELGGCGSTGVLGGCGSTGVLGGCGSTGVLDGCGSTGVLGGCGSTGVLGGCGSWYARWVWQYWCARWVWQYCCARWVWQYCCARWVWQYWCARWVWQYWCARWVWQLVC